MDLTKYKRKPWYKTIFMDIEYIFWSCFMIFPPLGMTVLYFRYGESLEPHLSNYYEYDESKEDESC